MAENEFKITRTPHKDVDVLAVQGYLDAHTFSKMEEVITKCFEETRYKLIIDLTKVQYISSAGAGVFIWAIGESQDNRGNVVLMRPTPPVKEVFDLLGLSEMFEIKESLQESLKVFVATPPKTPGR